MDDEIRNEIMFNIQAEIEQNVDERQLLNLVKEQEDFYELKVYGYHLKFDKTDGSLITND